MNIPASQIENILRLAPRPKPPNSLKDRLVAQIQLPVTSPLVSPRPTLYDLRGWSRRWWPALASAMVSLACVVVMAVQQMEIRDLKASIRALPQGATATQKALSPSAGASEPVSSTDLPPSAQQEIERLKQRAAQLSSEIARLEQLNAENKKLQTQLTTLLSALTPAEEQDLARTRERAMSIQCVQNLKQLGLALRVWAGDNNDSNPNSSGVGISPPDVLSMSNELGTPLVLVCPSDTNRQIAVNWSSFATANCSYEYLAPSTAIPEESRVVFRCPIHGSVGLGDGSVQMQVAKFHPEWLVHRDGKLYFESPNYSAPRPGPQAPGARTP